MCREDDGCPVVSQIKNFDNIALLNKSEKILDGKVHEIKNAYKANIFEIGYLGQPDSIKDFIPATYELLNNVQQNGNSKAQIKIPASATPNDLMQKLLPHLEMHSFNEILPTMNDIFIQKVNEQKR